MKLYIITINFLLVFLNLSAQDKAKPSFTINYSPNFSGVTDKITYDEEENRKEKLLFSNNVNVKMDYFVKKNNYLTIGCGFMNFGILTNRIIENSDLSIINNNFKNRYQYLTIPFGYKLTKNNFYFSTEIAAGFLINAKYINVDSRDTETVGKYISISKIVYKPRSLTNNRRVTFIHFVSFGREFKVNRTNLHFGIKAYHSISDFKVETPPTRKYQTYGLGILAGYKF